MILLFPFRVSRMQFFIKPDWSRPATPAFDWAQLVAVIHHSSLTFPGSSYLARSAIALK